jgi:hypothetical protein
MTAAPADPTMAALESLKDPKRWVVVRSVPVFCAHRRKVRRKDPETGEMVDKEVVVTEDDLRDIVNHARALTRETGAVPGLWMGHRNPAPDFPEERQPKLVGLTPNWRMGTWGPKKKTAILVDLYYDRRFWHETQNAPYRSAEYYPDQEITGVALLRRDPQLDLGLILNARDGEPVLYAADETPPGPGDPTEPPGKPGEGGGDSDDPEDKKFMDRFAKCMERYLAAMGPNNGGWPAPVPADAKKRMEGEPDRLQRSQEHLQYRRLEERLAEQDRKLKALEAGRQEDALRYARNEASLIIEGLDRDGYVLGPPEKVQKMAERMSRMSAAERLDYEREVREHWARAPVGGGWLDTRDASENYARSAGARDGGDSPAAPPHGHAEAVSYMRANPGTQYEQALAHVTGGKVQA